MSKPSRIQRSRRKGSRLPSGAVCVTRPGPWGNPFKGPKAVDNFRAMMQGFWAQAMSGLEEGPLHRTGFHLNELSKRAEWMKAHLHELRGKNLACFCALDKPCHADILLELANA